MITQSMLEELRKYEGSEFAPYQLRFDAVVAQALSFKTKDEYLAWVKDWKAQYAQMSQDIRQAKRNRKTTLPSYDPEARSQAWHWRARARVMLFLRKEGKMQSRLQRQAALTPAQ